MMETENNINLKTSTWPVESIFMVLAFVLLPITLLSLYYPPPDIEQGQAQRIFYVHVPIAWVALYTPIISAICGLLYLFKPSERLDVWSVVNARLSFIFSIGVLFTGMLWAHSEWGRDSYWVWSDERLMTFFILFLVLCGYMLVRYLTDHPERRARFSALMAILAAIASLITFFIIRVLKPDIHPQSVQGQLSPMIQQTFWLAVLAYHLFFWFILRYSIRQEYIKRAFQRARAAIN